MPNTEALGPSLSAIAQAPDTTGARQEKLRKVAQEFEALFVGTLLRSMRSTVLESNLLNSQGATKYYRQLYDEQIARTAASSGSGLGIADLIVGQFARQSVDGAKELGGARDSRRLAISVSAGARQYARQAATGEGIARMVRLRAAAEKLGGAVADSLRRFQPEIARASETTGVDPGLLLSVMIQESGGDPQAQSSQGAQGLMQLMPGTAREVGVREPWHPGQNILGGARYLARLAQRFGPRLELVLAAYNAGPGAVQAAGEQIPPYRETRHYVARVLDLYQRLAPDSGTKLATTKPDP